jgi:hypothetical protein
VSPWWVKQSVLSGVKEPVTALETTKNGVPSFCFNADMEDDYIEDIANAVNASLDYVKTSSYESSDEEELRSEFGLLQHDSSQTFCGQCLSD